jgi:TatD DNase family protein
LLDDALCAKLQDLSQHPKVIAWGEIGLDYHYDNSPREVQREAFRKQLRMARERGLPISIHTREAEADTLAILDGEWRDSGLGGVIHCFTGTRAFAEAAVELGFLISFSGVVTFKKAEDLRETARRLPMDRVTIETDAPFLAPVPYRGRRNEPAYVVETARALAELRGTTVEEIGRATSENFARLFKLA